MSKSEEFLDLIENHHYKGSFYDDNRQNFCLLGAANKVYGAYYFSHLAEMTKIVEEYFPESVKQSEKIGHAAVPHFNDHYGTKEDIMLVAKHFANKIDTIKE